jgi:hypothetical protein
MIRPSTSFPLVHVITRELHLCIAHPLSRSDPSVKSPPALQPAETNLLKRSLAAAGPSFRLGSTRADALAADLDRAFRP